jgi:DNA repair exonuclease SbcCD ATPase subunit
MCPQLVEKFSNRLSWPSPPLLFLLLQKLRAAAEKRAMAANEQVQHLAAQLEDVQTVSMARMLADKMKEAEADVGGKPSVAEEEQAQQDEQQRENDAEVRCVLAEALVADVCLCFCSTLARQHSMLLAAVPSLLIIITRTMNSLLILLPCFHFFLFSLPMQAAHLEAQLAVVAGDHERLQQRFVQLEGELESVRRSASQEQARLAGHASALATELEEERRASAQALSYQLGEVQTAAEEAGAVADQLAEAQREAAAARALADEIKDARAAAAAAASMSKELEALRQEAASARGLASRLQVAEQELAHAKTLAGQLEEERATAAAAQAACHTAKGRSALLEKAWSTALEVRHCPAWLLCLSVCCQLGCQTYSFLSSAVLLLCVCIHTVGY